MIVNHHVLAVKSGVVLGKGISFFLNSTFKLSKIVFKFVLISSEVILSILDDIVEVNFSP